MNRGRAIPMIIASACIEGAASHGGYPTSSGRAQDKRREIDARICAAFDMVPGRVAGQRPIDFEIFRKGDGVLAISIERDDRIIFDHVITPSWATQFQERYRQAH